MKNSNHQRTADRCIKLPRGDTNIGASIGESQLEQINGLFRMAVFVVDPSDD